MRFAKYSAILFAILCLSFHFVWAQEEFIEKESVAPAAPKTQGMFDEEVEFEDPDMGRPGNIISEPEPIDDFNQRNTEADRNPPRLDFPEPKKPSAASSTRAKSLPQLPGGKVDIPNSNERVRMDFVQVEIEDVVKYFAERLQKKFLYDPSILSGKITIVSPTEVTLREAWGAFLSALEVRGYIVFPAGAYLKIEKAANARKAPVPVYVGGTPNDDSYVTRIITLKFLSVNDVRQAVRNLLSRTGGDVIEHAPTNTLIISDYAYNIRRIVRILDILDIEGFQEQIAVLPLKHASASEVARKISDFFPTGGAANSAMGGAPAPSIRMRTRNLGGPDTQAVIQKVVADDRTNSIIILGSERGIDQVKKFIDQIDIPMEGGNGQIHVYPLQNVKAEDLSQTLAALASGQSKKRTNIPAPNPSIPPFPQPMGSTSDTASLLNGDVKITADNPTNSLVIQASQRDFDVLKSIIQKLDIRRRQVFIESAILEASVGKNSSFGTQVTSPFAKTSFLNANADNSSQTSPSAGVLSIGGLGSSLDALLQNPSALTGLALGFRSGGSFPVNYTDKDGNAKTIRLPLLSAIIRLSAGSQDLNVLSTPHVLATANEEATISIGQEVPQKTAESLSTGGTITNSITRLRVATELNITPQINAGDYLTLKIKQKVNELGNLGADGQYNTINREATTTVIVKDQQTIVMGGLMEDRKTVSITKVPFLGDIPILGWLFKTRDSTTRKVNLLLFITPHIIRDTGDMNDTFFRKLKEREGFLKELGMEEKKGIPSAGLTEEQLKMLDPEYVKSLRQEILVPLQTVPEGATEPVVPQTISTEPTPTPSNNVAPIEAAPVAPVPEPQPLTPVETPTPTPAPAPPLISPEGLPLPAPTPNEVTPAPKNLVPELQLEDSPPERPSDSGTKKI